jgi:hypothetical protein
MGPSGCGKSSLAAALCAAGAPLLTDDALHCEIASPVRCGRGSLELRLRSENAELARLFANATGSLDQRLVVRATPAPDARYPLTLAVAPEPGPSLHFERLSGADAATAMLKAARVTGWCAASQLARQFQSLATLARSTAVYRLSLPVGLLHSEAGRRTLSNEIHLLLQREHS